MPVGRVDDTLPQAARCGEDAQLCDVYLGVYCLGLSLRVLYRHRPHRSLSPCQWHPRIHTVVGLVPGLRLVVQQLLPHQFLLEVAVYRNHCV